MGKTPKERLVHNKSHFNILEYLGALKKLNAASIMNRKSV